MLMEAPNYIIEYKYDLNGNRTQRLTDSDGDGVLNSYFTYKYQNTVVCTDFRFRFNA